MKKIVFLPLDERPCNYMFPQYLYSGRVNLVTPPTIMLGDKKKEANVDNLIEFLLKECKDADGLVLSMDMLLYGGLLPSRIHHLSKDVLDYRLSILRKIKEENPKIKIYAFTLIMRCPKYSSDDEEPTYYQNCGKEIHQYGIAIHKQKLGILEDENVLEELSKKIPKKDLQDFVDRRKTNLEYNKKVLALRKDGIIDFLVIPQDDSAPYGFTAMDQVVVRDEIAKLNLLSKVLMYPGADEAGLVLLSRCVLEIYDKKPKVYIKYASDGASLVIPPYEDRPLGETVKYQIIAGGGRVVSSYSEADIVLVLTSPAEKISEANGQTEHKIEYDAFRNLIDIIEFIKMAIDDKKPVLVGDNAYVNGGDLTFLSMLNENNLLDKLASYAGWNTSSNTIGTAISQGYLYYACGESKEHFNFLALRYLEDCGYCGKIRKDICDNYLLKMGYNYFDVKEKRGEVAKLSIQKLNEFKDKYLSTISNDIVIKDVYMPWKRAFEIGIEVEWKK